MEKSQAYNMSQRSFFMYRMLPGLLTLILLTSPIWTSILGIYEALLFYLAFIATYIFYTGAKGSIGNYIGFKRYQRDIKRDWASEISIINFSDLKGRKGLPKSLENLYHIVFIPIYKEPYSDLKKTFDTLVEQDYPFKKNLIIVTAVEERAGKEEKEVIQKIKKKYSKNFYDIIDFYHPADIPGEIIGDACSNLRYASMQTSKWLKKQKINSEFVIFSKFDADTRLHKKVFSALTYKYLTNPDRTDKFYSPAILTYSNNYWDVPAITRMFCGTLTIGIIGEWITDKSKKQSFSFYSSNFKNLEDFGYWDASTGAEDTYFFWNVYLNKNGKFSGEEYYLPVTMDAVEGKSYTSALVSLYKQQLRWGWGAIIMSITMQGMNKNKDLGITSKLKKFINLFTVYNFMVTMSILLTFAMPVLTLINKELEFSSIAYMLPRAISFLLTISIFFQIPSKYYLWRYYGAPPKEKSLLFKLWWLFLEHFLLFVNIWTYYLLPRLHSQMEMLIGKERRKFFVSIEGKNS